MNILIFNWRDIKNPRAGGSEIYFHELAKRWVKKGNKVSLICGGWRGCKNEEYVDGIKIMRVGKELSVYFFALFAYLKLKEKPDVVIDVENGIPFFSPLFSGKKKFLHIHHIHKEVWLKESEGRGFKEKIIAFIGRFLETKAMPLIYKNIKIITLSKSSTEEIEKEKFGKVFGIVNPGIEFCKYKKMKKSKKPMLLFLNRIKRYKGIETLLKSIITLKKEKFSEIEVKIIGTGDDFGRMFSFAKANDLNNVSFLGKVSEEKKKELLQKAWIFVNPSFKEGWGMVNIESNYFGTPVIGSNVSGIKDSVVDGKTGLLFKYGDSDELAERIKLLIKNEKLRERLSKEALKWAKNFDWDVKSDEYLNILQKP